MFKVPIARVVFTAYFGLLLLLADAAVVVDANFSTLSNVVRTPRGYFCPINLDSLLVLSLLVVSHTAYK